jgi:hypothetical protein
MPTCLPPGVNFVTGRELMVPRNPPGQYAKRAFSWFLILLILVFTTFAALAAESLALLARKPENLCNPGMTSFVEQSQHVILTGKSRGHACFLAFSVGKRPMMVLAGADMTGTETTFDALNATVCMDKSAITSITACENRGCQWIAGSVPHDTLGDYVMNYGWVIISLVATPLHSGH